VGAVVHAGGDQLGSLHVHAARQHGSASAGLAQRIASVASYADPHLGAGRHRQDKPVAAQQDRGRRIAGSAARRLRVDGDMILRFLESPAHAEHSGRVSKA